MIVLNIRFCDEGYVRNQKAQQAIDIFFQMANPDHLSFMLFFNACAQLANEKALALGEQIFSRYLAQVDRAKHDKKVLNAAFDMFIKCDRLERAEFIFPRLEDDKIAYLLLMKAYNMKGEPEKTLSVFEQMQKKKIKPNEKIAVLVVNACSQIGNLSVCEFIVAQLPASSTNDLWMQAALVDMWVSDKISWLSDENY